MCPSKLPLSLSSDRDPALSDWRLFLVDWGYNTQPERARAAANPAITIIDKRQFAELLAEELAVAS